MIDDDIRARLAELIDEAAPPITLAELHDRKTANLPRVAPVRRRRVALVAIAAVLAAGVALVAVLRADRRSNPAVTTPASTEPATTTTTAPATVTKQLPVAAFPRIPASAIETFGIPGDLQVGQMVVAEGSAWLTGYRTSCPEKCARLYRLDRAAGSVEPIEGVPGRGLGLAYEDHALFVLSYRPDGSPYHVTRIDLPSYRVRYSVNVSRTHVFGNGDPRARIEAGFGSVWVYDASSSVRRLDAENGRQVARVPLPEYAASNGLAVSTQGVFGLGFGTTRLARIDPDTNEISGTMDFGSGSALSIAASGKFVWTTIGTRGLDLYRIDLSSPSLGEQRAAHIPTPDVAADESGVWFLGWEPGEKIADPRNHFRMVGEIDPRSLAVQRVTELPPSTFSESQIAVGDGAAWVVDWNADRVWRIAGDG